MNVVIKGPLFLSHFDKMLSFFRGLLARGGGSSFDGDYYSYKRRLTLAIRSRDAATVDRLLSPLDQQQRDHLLTLLVANITTGPHGHSAILEMSLLELLLWKAIVEGTWTRADARIAQRLLECTATLPYRELFFLCGTQRDRGINERPAIEGLLALLPSIDLRTWCPREDNLVHEMRQKTLLHFCARNNRTWEIGALLRKAAGGAYSDVVNAPDGIANTALHEAVECANEAVVKVLILNGADLNAVNERGQTPLLLCIEQMDAAVVQIVRLLVAAGADPTVVKHDGRFVQPCVYAVCNNRTSAPEQRTMRMQMLDFFLSNGEDVDTRSLPSRKTALVGAILRGFYDAARTLMARGADVNARDRGNPIQLHYYFNIMTNVPRLDGNTVLHHCAASVSDPDGLAFLRYLVSTGVDPTVRNNRGQIPLAFALDARHGVTADVIATLSEAVADSEDSL